MTNDRTASLREHLLYLLGGGGAHLDFEKAIAGLAPELRGAKPAGVPHTPWRLLEHLRIAQWDILEFSRDPGHLSPTFPDGYWPQSDAPPDAGAWDRSVAAFRADLRAMQALVADPATDLFTPLPHGDGQTILREALLVADHNAYHLGQLVVVRRLLGAWEEAGLTPQAIHVIGNAPFAERIEDTEHLEDLLSEPTESAVQALARLDGDLMLLGVGGKMGPTLARMARRAFDRAGLRRRVIGVARFSEDGPEERLRANGVETVRCDLLDPEQLQRLPEAENVLVMVGMKFGSTGQEARTWAVNAFLSGLICQRFRHSRIVAFSTGNVYGLSPVALGGSVESDALAPVGEYSLSCVGRERIYEHFSRALGIPLALLRLNYATEMRYGVLVDLAQRVRQGVAIDLSMGHLNAIWQADANAAALSAFDHVAMPPLVLNLAGPELLSVRRLAEQFAGLFGRPVSFTGTESADAFLSNAQRSHRLFGYPRVPAGQMVLWIADWLRRGGPTLGKPTHFEARDGKF